MACPNSCVERFVLSGLVSELSFEFDTGPGGFRTLVVHWWSSLINSVESWNADSALSRSVNFKRWWRKSVLIVHEWSYRKVLFNFLEWTRFDQVPGPGENRHVLI